ncbi:hypothetical protein BDP27DRAFT_1368535 [Rhodocollybia butyracea]|uniref:C2H2-type domain-containing protein n=1 Tax=Rhodocollybia butyracea TaxID=206335 RepID=A0A9P5PCX3_9AGAR|nr:hypothetical protein BDP27DRAFT_1368535 [Rhodocollybia butyracea]
MNSAWACLVCGKAFTRPGDRERHIKAVKDIAHRQLFLAKLARRSEPRLYNRHCFMMQFPMGEDYNFELEAYGLDDGQPESGDIEARLEGDDTEEDDELDSDDCATLLSSHDDGDEVAVDKSASKKGNPRGREPMSIYKTPVVLPELRPGISCVIPGQC